MEYDWDHISLIKRFILGRMVRAFCAAPLSCLGLRLYDIMPEYPHPLGEPQGD